MSEPNAPTIRIDTITDQQVTDVIAQLRERLPQRRPLLREIRWEIVQTLYTVDVWANYNMVVARDVLNRVRGEVLAAEVSTE